MRLPLPATLVASVLLLAGCVTEEPARTVPPGELPAPEVVVRAEGLPADFYDRALSESLAVIDGYLAESDVITSVAGVGSDRIQTWVTPAWYPMEQQGFIHYQETGERTVGKTMFEDSVVQVARLTPERTLDIAIYGCVDTTGVFVLAPDHVDPPEEVLSWHPGYEEFVGDETQWQVIEAFYSQEGVRWGDRRAIVFWLVGDSFDSLAIDSSSEWWGAHAC